MPVSHDWKIWEITDLILGGSTCVCLTSNEIPRLIAIDQSKNGKSNRHLGGYATGIPFPSKSSTEISRDPSGGPPPVMIIPIN